MSAVLSVGWLRAGSGERLGENFTSICPHANGICHEGQYISNVAGGGGVEHGVCLGGVPCQDVSIPIEAWRAVNLSHPQPTFLCETGWSGK